MNNINEMANKLLLFWHSEGDDLFDNASKALLQQQAEIEALKEQLTQIAAEDKKLFEAVQRANDVWDKATGRKP
jgi:hypothetical protein